jgi:outer membrane protein assembly factor BamA
MEKAYAKTYGGFILYSYPFSTFDRIEAQSGYRGFNFITNVETDGSNIIYYYDYQNRNLMSLSYVHDSTLWDITGPIDGFRYELTLSKSFQFYQNSLNYEKAVFDFRSYFMILPNLISGYSFAFRAVAGKVFDTDKNKYPFYLGGFNSIRGYDIWSFQGDNMYLFNFELRIPFIYDWTIGFPFPIRMPTIWGVLFWDFGSVWNSEHALELFETRDNAAYLKDLKSGLGFGFRLVLMPAIKLMVNFATPYDGSPIPQLSAWQTFWLIGIDF